MVEERQKDVIVASAALVAAAALAVPIWKKIRLSRVPVFKLKSHGVEVHISALGGIIQRLYVVDAHGKTVDIVLGHEKISSYLVRVHLFVRYKFESC